MITALTTIKYPEIWQLLKNHNEVFYILTFIALQQSFAVKQGKAAIQMY